jgi:capsular polysaccharide biosynthesis protein
MNQVAQRDAERGELEAWGRGLTLKEVVMATWTFRWSALAIVLASTVLAAVIAFIATPIYRAEVLLSPLQDEGPAAGGLGGLVRQLGDIAPLVGMSGLDGVGLKEETMALVKSRSFLEEFLADEKLMPVLYPELSAPGAAATEDGPTLGDAYRRFDRSILSVDEDKDSGLIRLSVEWQDPQVAAQWANKLVARINDHMRTRAIAEAERSIEYLRNELNETSILGIQDSINRLIESNISTIALARSRDGYALRVIDAAVAPEAKEFVRPRRVLLLALGVVGGSILAFFVVLVRLVWQRS